MKNKNGFTLVELIAVIAIIAVISIMSFTSVTRTIRNNELKEIEVFEDNVKTATQIFVETNLTEYPDLENVGGYVLIKASTVIEAGFLNKDIDNPTSCKLSSVYALVYKAEDYTINYKIYCEGDDVELPTATPSTSSSSSSTSS